MRALRWATCALILAFATSTVQAAAQDSYFKTRDQARNFNALVAAEDGKSTLCSGYLGQTITPTPFAAFPQKMTSANRAAPVVLAVPINRDYLRYDAEAGAMFVSAGAFPANGFSAAAQADAVSNVALLGAGIDAPILGGAKVAIGESERVLSTQMGRNIFGQPVRVSNVERHTRGLYLGKGRLFPLARNAGSAVMAFDLPKAQATTAKTTLRAAVVVIPRAPYLLTGSGPGAAANAQQPAHYIERWSIVVARPQCALILDDRSKVLGSADIGPAKDAGSGN